jgi:hypothetical protein
MKQGGGLVLLAPNEGREDKRERSCSSSTEAAGWGWPTTGAAGLWLSARSPSSRGKWWLVEPPNPAWFMASQSCEDLGSGGAGKDVDKSDCEEQKIRFISRCHFAFAHYENVVLSGMVAWWWYVVWHGGGVDK